MVYTVSADDLEPLLTANSQTMRNSVLVPLPWTYLASADMATDKGTYTISLPATDEEQGESSDKEDGTDNSEEVKTDDASDDAENPAKDLWESIHGLRANEWIDHEDQESSPLLTIHATSQEGKEITIAFYEHDAETYLATIDERQSALVSAEKIDSILRSVRLMIP